MTKSADAMTRSDALTEIFNFMDHKVRVVIPKGQDGGRAPWFVATDVCRCLGIHIRSDGNCSHNYRPDTFGCLSEDKIMIWALIPSWLKYSLAALVAAFLLAAGG